MTQAEREKSRRDLIADVVKAVREEMRIELILAGIGQPPEHWANFDRVKLAERLRIVADELDPPEVPE